MDDLAEKLIKMLGSQENIEKIKNFSSVLKDQDSDTKTEESKKEINEDSFNDFPADTLNIVMKLINVKKTSL